MSQFFVKVNKKAYQAGDHIEFLVIKEEEEEKGGYIFPHKQIEHHLKENHFDKKKLGLTNELSRSETPFVAFFDLGDDYNVGYLTDIAEEIQKVHVSYEDQYNAFISKLMELGFTKIIK